MEREAYIFEVLMRCVPFPLAEFLAVSLKLSSSKFLFFLKILEIKSVFK